MRPTSRCKKALLWFAGAAGLAVLLVIVTVFAILPWLLNTDSIKAEARKYISEKAPGRVDFGEIDISFFPVPQVKIHQVSLVPSQTDRGHIKTLTVYPEILPLFRGQVRIGRIALQAPDFTLQVPERGKDEGPLTPAKIRHGVVKVIENLTGTLPELVLSVEGGNLRLLKGDGSSVSFRDINGRVTLPPDNLRVNIACASDFSGRISIEGRLEPQKFAGKGNLRLANFNPQMLGAFFAARNHPLGDSPLNLDLSFEFEGDDRLNADMVLTAPRLTIRRRGRETVIQVITMKAAVKKDKEKTEVVLTGLDLDDPRLSLSGSFQQDSASRQLRLMVEGRDIDVSSARQAALNAAGDQQIIRDIFRYIRSGKVPHIVVESRGNSTESLGATNSIDIRGSIVDGEVYVEPSRLDFTHVTGDAHVKQGILYGTNIKGRVDTGRLTDATLMVGLKGAVVPLNLDTKVDVNLPALQRILRRLIKNDDVVREINLMHEVTGTVRGRLILGNNSESPTVSASVNEALLSARYERIPYPVQITGGQVLYDDTGIELRNLTGLIGKSSFSDLTAQVHLKDTAHIDVNTSRFSLSLDEIHTWLKSYEGLRERIKDIHSLDGLLIFSSLSLKGPLSSPRQWLFSATGSVTDITADSPLLDGPAALMSGSFKSTPERLDLSQVRARILDASLNLSGTFNGYLGGLEHADITAQGTAGPRAFKWIKKTADLPEWVKDSLQLSIARSHTLWEKNGNISFEADLNVAKGPAISLNVQKNPAGLKINRLRVEDGSSLATMSLALQGNKAGLAFSGRLTGSTIDSVIACQEYLDGWMDGEVTAEITTDKPVVFHAQGKLQGEKFVIPREGAVPLKIANLSLNAQGDRLMIETASLTWGDTVASLKGVAKSSNEGVMLDLDISAKRINWSAVEEDLAAEKGKGKTSRDYNFDDPPVRGIVRLRADRFSYGRYSLAPLHADFALTDRGVDIAVIEANLCSISFPGSVGTHRGDLSFTMEPAAKNQNLDSTITCLRDTLGISQKATGTFDLKGRFEAHGKRGQLLEALDGGAEITARDGRIYQEPSLLKILAFLEVTEYLRGFPDIRKEGLAYNSIKATLNLGKGRLELTESFLDGGYLKVAGEGTIDLRGKTIDANVLVTSLKTMDTVIGSIPLIGTALAETVTSIPLKVTGRVEDPSVVYIPGTQVGPRLLKVMKGILNAPMRLFDRPSPGDRSE